MNFYGNTYKTDLNKSAGPNLRWIHYNLNWIINYIK